MGRRARGLSNLNRAQTRAHITWMRSDRYTLNISCLIISYNIYALCRYRPESNSDRGICLAVIPCMTRSGLWRLWRRHHRASSILSGCIHHLCKTPPGNSVAMIVHELSTLDINQWQHRWTMKQNKNYIHSTTSDGKVNSITNGILQIVSNVWWCNKEMSLGCTSR